MTGLLVIGGGRVIDPLSGFDEVADIAVSSGRITDIGPALEADERLDATSLVVAPGFIDVHSHVHSISGRDSKPTTVSPPPSISRQAARRYRPPTPQPPAKAGR